MKDKRIHESSEELRIKYKYRKLLAGGKLKIPYADAVKLIGQDSAYKLLSILSENDYKKKKGGK